MVQRANSGITLTEAAAARLQDLLDDTKTCFRLGARGGGCAGYNYVLALDYPHDNDLSFESNGIKIIVADECIHLVDGSTVDFVTEGISSGFQVENPHAVAACGCGGSFRINDINDDACSSC